MFDQIPEIVYLYPIKGVIMKTVIVNGFLFENGRIDFMRKKKQDVMDDVVS